MTSSTSSIGRASWKGSCCLAIASHNYTLVWPSQADAAKRRISVLAPMGTALLGCRAGDRVEWQMPGGLVRLTIEEVR